MKSWLLGKRGGLVAFLAIAILVLGGLAWLTAAALQLEAKEHQARVEADLSNKLRLALWRLDSRVFPLLARESSRPYYHYSPTYNPPLAYTWTGKLWQQVQVIEPSPLLNEPLPEWIVLHFQIDQAGKWESPQVPPEVERQRLEGTRNSWVFENVTSERQAAFEGLQQKIAAQSLLSRVEQRTNQLFLTLGSHFNFQSWNSAQVGNRLNNEPGSQGQVAIGPEQGQAPGQPGQAPPPQTLNQQNDFQARAQQRAQLETNYGGNVNKQKQQGESNRNAKPPVESVTVTQGLTAPLWLHANGGEPILLTARLVQVGDKELCQGILLDWPQLRQALTDEVRDLFPSAEILPVFEDVPLHPERTMTALPLELAPGEPAEALSEENWTPLRIGLAAAWGAALLALLAVGLGGWSLIDLSERRIRFVSAVTHELRTPLTTLRLYLDMLTGGLVTDDTRKTEYLHTLNTESERLNRLISNVLDFSRLENQRPRLDLTPVDVAALLELVRSTWVERCKDAGKELVIENGLPLEMTVTTDSRLVQQILGNLIDNACKYSKGANDPYIRLRARPEVGQAVVLEVADGGPGVPLRDRRLVFRPFRRGRSTDPALGGVGLGLALSQRWARLLGGELTLCHDNAIAGACFTLRLPTRTLP
jgi:signal transduction histidine kinase